jgi:hypothetical protein
VVTEEGSSLVAFAQLSETRMKGLGIKDWLQTELVGETPTEATKKGLNANESLICLVIQFSEAGIIEFGKTQHADRPLFNLTSKQKARSSTILAKDLELHNLPNWKPKFQSSHQSFYAILHSDLKSHRCPSASFCLIAAQLLSCESVSCFSTVALEAHPRLPHAGSDSRMLHC